MLKATQPLVGNSSLKQQAVRRLKGTLEQVPFLGTLPVRSRPAGTDTGIDFAVTVKTRRSSQPRPISRPVFCRVQSSGQPRIAREACLRLAEEVRANPRAYAVFIAPYISPEAAAICTRYDTGYLDFAGNCRLAFDTVFIKSEGFPNPAVQKRNLRSLYSPKAERVLRVLLSSGPRAWRTLALAEEAQVSLGQVASVKKLLTDREWIESGPTGFGLSGHSLDGNGSGVGSGVVPLLAEWARAYRPERSASHGYYSIKPIPETEALLVRAAEARGVRMAFTGFPAAARFAPAVRYTRVSAYVESSLEQVAEVAGLKAVSTGANVSLIAPYDTGVFFGSREIDQAPVVSPVQLYLDLSQMKGRGEEAAQAILEEAIKPLWP